QLVRVQRYRQRRAALRVEQTLLGERVSDPLDDPSFDLALSAERVDDPADVVDRSDALDADLPGLDIDGDLGDLDPEGQHAHPGRVRPPGALPQDLGVLEQSGYLLERPRAAVRRDHLAVLDVEHALLEAVALRGDLDQLSFRIGGRGTNGRAHRGRRRRAGGDRRVGPARRVAELDPHVAQRYPELLGRDLRHRRPGPRADVLHRRHDDGTAVRPDPDPRIRRRTAAAVPGVARKGDHPRPGV